MTQTERYFSALLEEEYFKILHESGLEIYVLPKKMSGRYAIFSTKFGGRVTEYEIDGETRKIPMGCAHFLEHKLFDNKDRPSADEIFSSYGAYDNAYTSSERTAYLFTCTDNFDECLAELLSFVTQPYFTKKTVDKEIGIIAEEIRGCADDPYDRCYLGLLDGMYHADPVKNEICGTESSISEITPEILYDCCRAFYRPQNMILTVCGDVTPDGVLKMVDAYIPKSSVSHTVKLPAYDEPREVKRAYTEINMPVGKPIIYIGIKDVDIPSAPYERMKKNEAANILCRMMFSESGEFYGSMLEKGIISPGFDCGYSSGENTAFVMMSGESDDPDALVLEIKKYIEKCARDGFDPESFEREKRAAYAAYAADFDSTEDLAFALLSFGDDKIGLFEYPKILSEITLEYTESLLDVIFRKDNISVSVVRPIDEKNHKKIDESEDFI